MHEHPLLCTSTYGIIPASHEKSKVKPWLSREKTSSMKAEKTETPKYFQDIRQIVRFFLERAYHNRVFYTAYWNYERTIPCEDADYLRWP